MELIGIFFRQGLRQWKRSFLTAFGIAIGITSVLIINAIGRYGANAVSSELESLGLGSVMISVQDKTVTSLTDRELEILRADRKVTQASPVNLVYTKSTLNHYITNTVLFGVDETAGDVISLGISYGRGLQKSDILLGKKVCLVDGDTAFSAYSRKNIVGKEISLLINGVQEVYTIIGIVTTGNGLLQNALSEYIPTFVYLPYTALQKSLGVADYDQIVVQTVEEKDAETIGEQLVQLLERRLGTTEGYIVRSLAGQKDSFNVILQAITLALTAISGISLLVSGINITTMMTASVTERVKEIGIKKSIGASDSIILWEFLTEALMISLIGGLGGMIFGGLCLKILAWIFNISLTVGWQTTGKILCFLVLLGTTFGVVPAIKASRMQPIDALRTD